MKKITAIFLSFIFAISLLPVSAFADAAKMANDTVVETAVIDGITYTYETKIENGNKTTVISNSANDMVDIVDIIDYNGSVSNVYCNGELIATIETSKHHMLEQYETCSDDIWTHLSSDTSRVTWAKGVAISVAAEVIAGRLGVMTGAVVITQMGASVLQTIVMASVGGTLSMDYYILFAPPAPNSYRLDWKFTASSGDAYGPYTYMYA